ncbi:hypothetical protein R5R35_011801 [Gryllus longicercus]|uniref:Uncharacterized protein n=1 Tax=Gryllus longicercus TaxID=2509291 RepID=A0AAN9VQX5_9ORTH
MRGIMAISDIVHDPEKVCEAVRVGLAAKLIDLMQDEDPRVRERSCAVAETLAGYSVGRDAVLAEPYTVPVLKMLTFDPVTAVRFRAALTLRILARFRLGPYDLDEADLAPFLVHLLLWEVVHEIIAVHLAALQLLLELDSTKEICIYQGAFNPLHAFMHMHLMPQVAAGAMECMSRLASCTLGKLVGDQLGIVSSLQIRLMLCAPDPDLCRSAAMLVMNLTHTTHGKQAAVYSGLMEPLLEVAKHRANRGAQLCSLQALTNMAENMQCREFLLEIEDDLEELEVSDDDTEGVRQRLLSVVRWKP